MNHPDIAVPREARPYQGETAGLATRLVANTIDALVVAVALGLCYLGFASLTFLLSPREFTFPETGLLFSVATALGLATAYLTLAWWLVGRTYGDHIMGVRVTGWHGRRLGPLRSLGRAVFCVFFPIGLFWCVVSPERRSVQDVVLWTRVVYDWLPLPGHEEHEGHEDREREGDRAGHADRAGHGDRHGNGDRPVHGRREGHGHADEGSGRASHGDASSDADAGSRGPLGGPPAAGDASPDRPPTDSGDAPRPDRPVA